MADHRAISTAVIPLAQSGNRISRFIALTRLLVENMKSSCLSLVVVTNNGIFTMVGPLHCEMPCQQSLIGSRLSKCSCLTKGKQSKRKHLPSIPAQQKNLCVAIWVLWHFKNTRTTYFHVYNLTSSRLSKFGWTCKLTTSTTLLPTNSGISQHA